MCPGPDKTIRLFFALWPDDNLSHSIHQLTGQIRKQQHGHGRPVPESKLHMTLAFLGNVAADKLDCVRTAADRVQGEAFSLELTELVYRKRQQMVWLCPIETPAVLVQLYADLAAQLKTCDIPLEQRPYLAHMTLMRKLDRWHEIKPPQPMPWDVRKFVLVQSVPEDDHVRYDIIGQWALA
jgi:2'-5' RNA ligase